MLNFTSTIPIAREHLSILPPRDFVLNARNQLHRPRKDACWAHWSKLTILRPRKLALWSYESHRKTSTRGAVSYLWRQGGRKV
jgi:hypothetical protein